MTLFQVCAVAAAAEALLLILVTTLLLRADRRATDYQCEAARWEMRSIADARLLEFYRGEVTRILGGGFTEVEFQNFCYNLKPDALSRFRRGCEEYQAKLFGLKAPVDSVERAALREHYAGQTEPCCECGHPYPRAHLVIDGQLYCEECRKNESTKPRW